MHLQRTNGMKVTAKINHNIITAIVYSKCVVLHNIVHIMKRKRLFLYLGSSTK